MEDVKIKEYLHDNNYLTIPITDKYYIWLDNASGSICVELCDYNNYDSDNINDLFDFNFDNITIKDIKNIALNKLINIYLDRNIC
jgi:hypothetical protein